MGLARAWLLGLGGPALLLGTASAAGAQEGRAREAAPEAEAPRVPRAARPGLILEHPAYRPVEPPEGYGRAVRLGTRSEEGRPGDAYWQQRADYRIEARVHPARAVVEGSQTVTYHNNSPDTLSRLVLHLYQNVFSRGVQRNRTVAFEGGINLLRIAAGGTELRPMTGEEFQGAVRARGGEGGPEGAGGFFVSGTIGYVLLPGPLAPGGTVELQMEWSFPVPASGAFRMGHLEHEIFNVAQWYPQVAVYDDVFGQDASPYLGNGEFYTDFGSFEVAVTVPAGWLVGATGTLQNAEEVLTRETLRRLEKAASSTEVVGIVTEADREAGAATSARGGELTWRFRADSVRDFAFAAGSRYVWDATSAHTGDGGPRALIHVLRDPGVHHWQEAASYAKHAIEFFSDYVLPYPYPHATVAFGPPHVGGMEYPMLTFINRRAPGEPLYSVIAHELGHFWFPMVVQSKEMAYAWMDEGTASFIEALARADFYGNENARRGDMETYLRAARAGVEAPVMEHTDYVEEPFGRVVAAYMKPATLLHSLRRLMGEETFDAALRSYAREWSFRRPLPWDFFAAMERAAEEDLDWFWRAWFYDTVSLDQAIEEVVPTGGGVTVSVGNRGWGVMPVELLLRLEDGSETRLTWDADVWASGRKASRTLALSADVAEVVIDPDGYYPDVDRSNNVWRRQEAQRRPSGG